MEDKEKLEAVRKSIENMGSQVISALNDAVEKSAILKDVPVVDIEESIANFKTTITIITALLTVVPEINSHRYLEYLGTVITDLAGGPGRLQEVVARFMLEKQLEKSGVLQALKKGILQKVQAEEAGEEQQCNCPICKARRNVERATGRLTGRTTANGKAKLNS
jgi:hypothetical protein